MILHVPFEQFASTVKRVLQVGDAFVVAKGQLTHATAASPDRQTIVVSFGTLSVSDAKAAIEKSDLKVFEGSWHDGELPELPTETATPYVAAVAYVSGDSAPGLWVDAYEHMPTQVTVLKALYDEFRATGQVGDVSFEEFVRLARPTVVVSSPEELYSYVAEKR